jgi:glycosyltransferase involved in cell wall biosynthesis
MLLSIVIPVYHRQEGLNLLLSELSRMVNKGGLEKKIEIIVVDDGSMPPIRISDSKFTILLYRLDKNSGAPKARELGFQKSSGRFIHFHDSDDGFDEGWLARLVKELEASPELDIVLTARHDISQAGSRYRYQKFFHRHVGQPERIKQRLVYRNCMGPLGGVTFSRRVLEQVIFKSFASCQDWQMYLDAIEYAKVLRSCPEITYRFNVSGDDRISHNPARKLIGHLQLSRITASDSVFHRNIRLFYLMTCRRHIMNKKGIMLMFYKKNRFKLWFHYLLASIYWRLH